MTKMILVTHAENSINAGVVATVAHREPVEHKEHNVDVLPTAKAHTSYLSRAPRAPPV